MMLNLGGMRPRCRHGNGEMVSGVVRTQCAAGREGNSGSQSALLGRETEPCDASLGEEAALEEVEEGFR